MKVAVTCSDNEVFQHFGHTPGFAVFEIADNQIISETFLSSGESGHGALAAVLAEAGIEVLICGGIGNGAINALSNANIKVVGGAAGNVREVAEAFAAGSLKVRPNFQCLHHHHDHGEGGDCSSHDHQCGGSCKH